MKLRRQTTFQGSWRCDVNAIAPTANKSGEGTMGLTLYKVSKTSRYILSVSISCDRIVDIEWLLSVFQALLCTFHVFKQSFNWDGDIILICLSLGFSQKTTFRQDLSVSISFGRWAQEALIADGTNETGGNAVNITSFIKPIIATHLEYNSTRKYKIQGRKMPQHCHTRWDKAGVSIQLLPSVSGGRLLLKSGRALVSQTFLPTLSKGSSGLSVRQNVTGASSWTSSWQ